MTKAENKKNIFAYKNGKKWNHFEILAKGRSDTHCNCKIKETLPIQELKPTLYDNEGSEKLYLY